MLIELQAKDPKATLAKYFDVIAGTSTGGIITALLAASNSSDSAATANQQPFSTPSEIVKFFYEEGPLIFNKSRYICMLYEHQQSNILLAYVLN